MLNSTIEFNLTECLAQAEKVSKSALTLESNIGSIAQKNENPERQTQGFLDVDGSYEDPQLGHLDTPSISYAPDTSSDKNVLRDTEFMGKNFGWLKVQRDAQELLENDWQSFLLLSQIAFRALRYDGKFNKLSLSTGQALIGDHASVGLSRQQYRDASYRLEHVHKLATFKRTNKGTIATLTNSDIYDLNLPSKEPSKEPSKNHQGTTNKERKNLKEKTSKKAQAPFVGSADADRLCLFFVSRGKEKNTGFKAPKDLTKWRKAFELMLSADALTAQEIEFVITHIWDTFYGKNVQCPDKLREKFPQCYGYAKEHLEHQGISSKPEDSAENIRLAKSWESASTNCAPGYAIDATQECVVFIKPRGNGVQVPYNISTKEFKEKCRSHLAAMRLGKKS